MKCYYEVLEVSRDADDAEIKTAYRKLALKWHPDKNLDNSNYAKEQFQIVQQAYEVLSDRQERAWYDKHREQILRGSNSEFQDNSLDVFQYFTTACFKGYGNEKDSFYTVYRTVFENIAKEDMEFMEEKEEFCEIPSFGNSQTDYDRVAEFYAYWMNYSTKKSFVWLDPNDIKETRDRRYIKLMEKENKKVRQKAKKERNEEVRNLVAFVRKRDKRVQAQKKIQEQKSIDDKKKRELLSRQKRLERQQLNESGSQPEWAKFDNVKSELEEIERNLVEQFGEEFSNSEYEEDAEDLSTLYCVACNKMFKTPKAFTNHELSKKHRENVVLLKQIMLEEDVLEGANNFSDDLESFSDVEENHDNVDKVLTEQIENGDSPSDLESVEDVGQSKLKKKKKPRNVLSLESEDEHNSNIKFESAAQSHEEAEDFDFSSRKKQKKKNKKSSIKTKIEHPRDNNDEHFNEDVTAPSNGSSAGNPSNGMKNKKEKKTQNTNEVPTIDLDHNCITCKSSFSSKNKLFDHLKKTGHGVYIPTNVKSKSKKNIREK